MKNYKITYMVLGTDSISPLTAYVPAETEEQARILFMCSGKFYNTTDLSKVVISSIRLA